MKYKFSVKLFFVLTAITVIVMGLFIGVRYHYMSQQLNSQLEGRANEVAVRVAESVSPSIWQIYQKSHDRKFSSDVASAILDAEMASEFIFAINVYGNFGHLYLGRIKQDDGTLVEYTKAHSILFKGQYNYRIQRPVKINTMTIGAVEVIYSVRSVDKAISQGLLLEFLQILVVSTLFIGLLYWALRKSLILPMQSLQISRQTLDSLTEAVVLVDKNHNIIDVNNAFEKITGFDKSSVLGKRPIIKLPDCNSSETVWRDIECNKNWSGEISIYRKGKGEFPAWVNITEVRHGSKLVCRVGVFRDITEKKNTENQLRQMAYFDSLTKLPNRTFFVEKLDNEIDLARVRKRRLGLMFIDLDNFKWINDRYGHGVGDKYLMIIAGLLKNRVRKSDYIFRLGGDEFTIIATNIKDEQSLVLLANDIIKIASSDVEIEGKVITSGASVGVAFFPNDASSAELLIKHADAAMYQAKEAGRNQVCFFSHELEQKRQNNHDIEEALHRALEKGEFELYFQPKVSLNGPLVNCGHDIRKYQVVGAEALIRWRDSKNNLIEPDGFISIAEQSDMINDIGCWVVEAACKQLALWQNTQYKDLVLAINLSARQLKNKDLRNHLQGAIARYNLDPKLIELEVTESSVIENIEKSIVILKDLKSLGVTIAMDDFGTGFSSLSYLKLLPIDVLKIDRTFISGLPDDGDDVVIVKAIFSMAEAMNLNVVAEGIETSQQMEFLVDTGCQYSQGYHFSKPLPLEDFEEWVGEVSFALPKEPSNVLSLR